MVTSWRCFKAELAYAMADCTSLRKVLEAMDVWINIDMSQSLRNHSVLYAAILSLGINIIIDVMVPDPVTL